MGDTMQIDLNGVKHGLVTGGSSAGKAVLFESIAESCSDAGIPVFLADCRSSCSGLALTHPVTFWDLEAKKGLPLRTTVSELGPLLLSRMLDLNDVQSELTDIFFKIADANNLLLIDTKDFKALINYIDENNSEFSKEYGSISKPSSSAILRKVVSLEGKGAQDFLFEPAIDVKDFLTKDESGAGRIHIFEAKSFIGETTIYISFMLYLLSELMENLPDAAAGEAPQLVFVFDESALLFEGASRSFLNKLEQLLEGLQEKGIAVYFAADREGDIPESIGELLTEQLSAESPETTSAPTMLSSDERDAMIAADPLSEKYKIPFERDSAYEFLLRRGIEATEAADAAGLTEDTGETSDEKEKKSLLESIDKEAMAKQAKSSAQSLGTTTAGTIGRQIGKTVGSAFGDFGETLGGNIGASLGRGIMNTLFKA